MRMRVEPCSLASKLDWLATFNASQITLWRALLYTKSDVRGHILDPLSTQIVIVGVLGPYNSI